MENNHHHGLGAIEDPRPTALKNRNYPHHEFLATAVPILWQENDPSTWPVYSVRDQDGSGSCVGQGCAKALEVLTGKIYSAHPTYARRSNRPGEGMWLQDAGDIIKTIGAIPEAMDPSQRMNEAQMNVPVSVDVESVIGDYFFIPVSAGIDAVAAAIDQYKHVIWTFNICYSEWEKNVPMVNPAVQAYDGGHCNCGTYRTLWNSQKSIVDDDSWGITGGTIGTTGRRIITEDFFKKRCTGVMVFVPFVAHTGPKPKYQWTHDLSTSLFPSADVKMLQDALKYLGCMSSIIPSTGIFGPKTQSAVIAFQERYVKEVLTPVHLTDGNGNVFQYTRAELNKLFS